MRKIVLTSVTFCLAGVLSLGTVMADDCADGHGGGLLSALGLSGLGGGLGSGHGAGHGANGGNGSGYVDPADCELPRSHVGLTIPYNDHETAVIPKTRAVPPGWVIVGNWHHPMGHGFGMNCWKIQKLPLYVGTQLIIAANQPIPNGWAIVEEVRSPHTPGHKSLKIQKM